MLLTYYFLSLITNSKMTRHIFYDYSIKYLLSIEDYLVDQGLVTLVLNVDLYEILELNNITFYVFGDECPKYKRIGSGEARL